MAQVLLSPVGNGQQFFDNNGVPLAGGFIYTYQAGSSTPLTVYTDASGLIPCPNPIVLDSSGRVPTEIWMLTGYSYKFVIETSVNTTIQTLDNLYPILQNAPAVSNTVPSGLIAIWSGSVGSIPSGWYLCDGTNGTPDLRNSFLVGAGNSYAVGATGGSADAVIPAHTHTASSTSSVTDPGHSHSYSTGLSPIGGAGGSDLRNNWQTIQTGTSTTGVTVATSTTVNSTGVSGVGANLPPYFALAYIMKS